MLSIKARKLQHVTEEQFQDVRKYYSVTTQSLKKDVDALVEWYKKQPQLPDLELNREWIERILIINKCSMERTKKRIDMFFALRNKKPEYYSHRDPVNLFKRCRKGIISLALPKLDKDNVRIGIIKAMSTVSEEFNVIDSVKLGVMICDYRQRYEYCAGDCLIYDASNQTFGHLLKLYPSVLSDLEMIVKQGYGFRIRSIHIVNAGPTIEKLLLILKSVLTAKLSQRIKVHKNLDSLYGCIPKEILPKDYGGDEKSFDELIDDWENELCSEKEIQWNIRQEILQSNERLRPAESFVHGLFGIDGSFRQLTLD